MLVPKLRFKREDGTEYPEWEEKRLEEVLKSLYNGQTPSRSNNAYWNGDISWLSSGELNR